MPCHEKSPYPSGQAPHSETTPPARERAVMFVMAAAKHCRSCFRHNTNDCATRCPLRGALTLARDIEHETKNHQRKGN